MGIIDKTIPHKSIIKHYNNYQRTTLHYNQTTNTTQQHGLLRIPIKQEGRRLPCREIARAEGRALSHSGCSRSRTSHHTSKSTTHIHETSRSLGFSDGLRIVSLGQEQRDHHDDSDEDIARCSGHGIIDRLGEIVLICSKFLAISIRMYHY